MVQHLLQLYDPLLKPRIRNVSTRQFLPLSSQQGFSFVPFFFDLLCEFSTQLFFLLGKLLPCFGLDTFIHYFFDVFVDLYRSIRVFL